MTRTSEDQLSSLASRQAGAFTRSQAVSLGIRGRVLDGRVAQGLLREVQPHVYVSPLTPGGLAQQERAALLAVGPRAMLSHDNAAARWHFDVPTQSGVILTVPYACRAPALQDVYVMRSRHLEGVRRVRAGVPLTAPARTWVDLGRTRSAEELEAALARGLQRGTFTLAAIDAVMAVAGNRAGTGLVREVLPRYLPAWESVLSAAFGRLVLAAGLDLTPGHTLRHPDGEPLAVLDFADLARRIAFEVDGWHYHGSQVQQQRDRERDRRLLALGWVTVRFTTDDVLHRPQQVVAEVASLLRSRAA